MVIRVLFVCCSCVCCFDNQRGISGGDSSDTLSSDSYQTVYGLDVSNDRQEACWNEIIRDKIKMTVTVKVGQQIATTGVGAKAELSLKFAEGSLIKTKRAKRGQAVFTIIPDPPKGLSVNGDYHYLEVTAKIKGQPNVVSVISDGFAFVSECG